MFDDYATQWVPPFQRRYAQESMSLLMRTAAGVIVPNEFLARVYRQRYQVQPTIVPNPVEIVGSPPPRLPPLGRPVRIVYTGAIYGAHYDAFHSFLSAIRNWSDLAIELHVYTSTDRRTLTDLGITSPAVIHPPVSSAEALALQQSADLLFLPLAFHSAIPEVINTSAPGKFGELLASGRPVLVHAPADSFVTWYARTHECGAVVDAQDIAGIRHTLSRLIHDPNWRQSLVDRAWRQARQDFSIALAQARFLELLTRSRVGRNGTARLPTS